MSASPASISYLVERYVAGDCSAEELEQFFEAASSDRHREEIAAMLVSVWEKNNTDTSWLDKHLIFERMQQHLTTPVHSLPATRRGIMYRAIGWAAAIILILGAVAYYFSAENKITDNKQIALTNDMPPASDKVKLTLGDGSQILLDNSSEPANQLHIKTENNQLVYTGSIIPSSHTMTTPKGRTFSVRLSDGSIAWLNATSSITYPTIFTGNERTVKITGEVYLDIAPAKTPFIVDIDNRSKVFVLGTELNINAYSNEPIIKTTLINGSVKVNDKNKSLVLKPGQQSQLNNSGNLVVVTDADIEQVTAWKNGIFDFNNTGTREVFRELSRWYDINVEYKGEIPERTFSGQIGRDLNLSQVLKGLKGMDLHFSLNGNTLTITE